MKSTSFDLDQALAALDQPTALQFKQAVLTMLQLVKSRKSQTPFAQRIASHPAIGTWPAGVNGDQHLASLRDEWEP